MRYVKQAFKVQPGMMAPACNPSTQAEREDHELEVSLGYIVKPCLKKEKANYCVLLRSNKGKMLTCCVLS
jgi:hypothetical protein